VNPPQPPCSSDRRAVRHCHDSRCRYRRRRCRRRAAAELIISRYTRDVADLMPSHHDVSMMRSRNAIIVKAATVLTMSSIQTARASYSPATPSTMHLTSRMPLSANFGFGTEHATSFAYITRRCCINSNRLVAQRRPALICVTKKCNARDRRGGSFDHSLGTRMCSHSPESIINIQGDDDESRSSIALADLSAMMKESYRSGETDGIQDALKSSNILAVLSAKHNAEQVANQLIDAAVTAAGKDRGCLAAIINSILASCCGDEDNDADKYPSSVHPKIALAILDLINKMHSKDSTSMVTPDIVSLSLAYYALNPTSRRHHGIEDFALQSNGILDRARRMAKKAAGSQRRKSLVSERRRGGNTDKIDARITEGDLQSLYGPDIRVLHETSDVIVVSKPAGMVCYHSRNTGAGKITPSRKKKIRTSNANASDDGIVDGVGKRMDISLVDALLDCSVLLSTLNPSARGIVHRLDRGTSGAIVLAKTDEIHLRLIALFFLRRSEKKYFALVPGCNNILAAGNVEDDGSCVDKKKTLAFSLGSSGIIDVPVDGRPARSSYRVVRVFGKEKQPLLSPDALLLEVATLTGRKHQVRVHCASLGHPIFLDPLYASSSILESNSRVAEKGQKKGRGSSTVKTGIVVPALPKAIVDAVDKSNHQQERFFLHAASLSIREVGVSVNAPLPQWWVDTLDQFN
jgi:23S rRNA-/tRNA-specific pseudouridylate synthase